MPETDELVSGMVLNLVADNNAAKLLTAHADTTNVYTSGTSELADERAADEAAFLKKDAQGNYGASHDAWITSLSTVCNEAIDSARFSKNSTVTTNARVDVVAAVEAEEAVEEVKNDAGEVTTEAKAAVAAVAESGGYNLMKNADGKDMRVPVLASTGLSTETPKIVYSKAAVAAVKDDDDNVITAAVPKVDPPTVWGENNSFDSIKEVRQAFAGVMKTDDSENPSLDCFNGMMQFAKINGQSVDITYPQMTTLFSSKNVVSGTSLSSSNNINYLNKLIVDFEAGGSTSQKLRVEVIKKKTNADQAATETGYEENNAAATFHVVLVPLGLASNAVNLNNFSLEIDSNPAATAAGHISLVTSSVFSGAMTNELWAIEGDDAGTDIASYMRTDPTKALYSNVATNAKQALNLDFIENLKDAGASTDTPSVFTESQFNIAYNQTAAADRTLVKVAAINAVPDSTFVAKFDGSVTSDEGKLKAAIGYKRSWANEIEALATYAEKEPYSKFIKSGASLGRNGIETSAQDEQLIYIVSPTDYKATPVNPSLEKFEEFIADQTADGATIILNSLDTDEDFSTKVSSGETAVVMLKSNGQIWHIAALEVLFANGQQSGSGAGLVFVDPQWSMTFNDHIKYTSGSAANSINTSKIAINSAVNAKTAGKYDSSILSEGLLSVCEADEFDASNPAATLATSMSIAHNVANTAAHLAELSSFTSEEKKLRLLIREKISSERDEGSKTWDAALSNANEREIFSDFMALSKFADFITEDNTLTGGDTTFYNIVGYGERSSNVEDTNSHIASLPSLTGKAFTNPNATINFAAFGSTTSSVSETKENRLIAVNEVISIMPAGDWSTNATTNFVLSVLFGNSEPTTVSDFADRMETMKLIPNWNGKDQTVTPSYGIGVAQAAEDDEGNALDGQYDVQSGHTQLLKEFTYTPSGEGAVPTVHPPHTNWGDKAVLESVKITVLRQRYEMPENIENISTSFATQLATEAANYEEDRISLMIGSNAANAINLQDAYKDLIALASVLKSKSLGLGDTIISAVIRNVNGLESKLPGGVDFNAVKVAVMKAILEGHINNVFGTALPVGTARLLGALPYNNIFSTGGMNADLDNATLNTTNAIRYIPLLQDFGMTPLEVLGLIGNGDHPLAFVALLALTADNEGANQFLGTLEQAKQVANVNPQLLQNLSSFFRTLFAVDGYDRSADTTQLLIFKISDINEAIAESNTGITGSSSSFLINNTLDLV